MIDDGRIEKGGEKMSYKKYNGEESGCLAYWWYDKEKM